MRNRLCSLLLMVLACVWPLAVVHAADTASTPAAFQEGKDYVRLPTAIPTSVPGKAEVIEFFSYTCPHCSELEPTVQEWLKRKPADVLLTRIPVGFGLNWELNARTYYVAEALGALDKMHPLLFNAIHQEKRDLSNVEKMAAFFAEHGFDANAFIKTYNSFQTQTQLRRGQQLAQRYGVMGVPMIIVNGQYDVRSQRLFEVVDFLLAQGH